MSNSPGVLSPDEIDRALLFWVKESQGLHFSEEISLLQSKRNIPRTSSLYHLSPFLDRNGFLRITGRLRFANLDYDEKHPIILPKVATITTLISHHYHKSTLHGGTQLTLASIRRRFWIVGGCTPVKSIIHRCMICARQKSVISQQLMGQLPYPQVNQTRPFLHTGVDYAGPFQLRTVRGCGSKIYKGYLILFIYLCTSTIHLEVATDYSTTGFITAYKRFSGCRSINECLYSNRGTNLVGADKELCSLFTAASKQFRSMANLLSNDGTQWRFNPPAAPHFGGKWETGIKSVKGHLKKVIGSTIMTYEEFTTVLIQIEAVLNSRPLCAQSDNPASYEVLMAAHFLVGEVLTVVPEPSLFDDKTTRLSRWQPLQQMIDQFWKAWSNPYLQSIQKATKWFEAKNLPREGQLVLIRDERMPPSKWSLVRILRLHAGSDGLERVVTLKTPTTTLTRSLTNICLLPDDTNIEK